jgi:AcrR family transcriptional regulator
MTQVDAEAAEAAPAAPKLGRKRDHTRDPEILAAALEVLAETGFEGMTIDMVATRAKAGKATLYRRWPSKSELVIDAVACMKQDELDHSRLPDTGTLRGDLVAMIKPRTIEDAVKKMQIMAAVRSMISSTPDLADAANDALIKPRAAANRFLIQRAIDRGEVTPGCDIDTLCLVTPAMATYRTLIERRPVDREFLISLIDGVLLPALGLAPGAPPRR